MDIQAMVSLDKNCYKGVSRLSILTGIFVCLQMSDGGQIKQQDTISSFSSSPQQRFEVLEILLIQRNGFSEHDIIK